jgi:hypothetical protein
MYITFNTLSYVPLLCLADSFVKSRRGAFVTPASGLESRSSIMRSPSAFEPVTQEHGVAFCPICWIGLHGRECEKYLSSGMSCRASMADMFTHFEADELSASPWSSTRLHGETPHQIAALRT